MTHDILPDAYRTYILRVWHETGCVIPAWRASVAEVNGNQQIGFTDPAALVEFLTAEIQIGECKPNVRRVVSDNDDA